MSDHFITDDLTQAGREFMVGWRKDTKYGSRNNSHDEVRQYILEKKGVDIDGNFNFGSIALWILLVFVIVAGGIGIVKLWQQWQERKNNDNINSIDC